MTNAERRAAERAYNAVLARVRRLAAGRSRSAIASVDKALREIGRRLKATGSGELTTREAASMIARISEALDTFEAHWALETRAATSAILKGIVVEHRKVNIEVARVLGLKDGGVALRIGRVPIQTERLLRAMRKGRTVRSVTSGHVEEVNRAMAEYLRNAVGKMPSDDAMRGIQRLLRGELPVDLGGMRKADVRIGASLPAKTERLIVTESFEGYRQAQAKALAGGVARMVAKWETAGDDVVCPICTAILNDDVGYGPGWYPPDEWPANPHPWCRCGQGEIKVLGE